MWHFKHHWSIKSWNDFFHHWSSNPNTWWINTARWMIYGWWDKPYKPEHEGLNKALVFKRRVNSIAPVLFLISEVINKRITSVIIDVSSIIIWLHWLTYTQLFTFKWIKISLSLEKIINYSARKRMYYEMMLTTYCCWYHVEVCAVYWGDQDGISVQWWAQLWVASVGGSQM